MSTKPPGGTRDFLPDEIRRREYVIGVVRDVYERYGFEPLETPAFENIETLLGKYGEEGNKLIFKILRRGEHEGGGRRRSGAALRPDGAARARRRPVPERAAAVLQALPDSAGLARRSPGARTVSRVLSVRHRRDRHDVEPRRGRTAGGGERRAGAARLRRFHDPAESSPAPDWPARELPACPPPLHADALVAIDKLDKIGARRRARGAGRHAASTPAAALRRVCELFEADFARRASAARLPAATSAAVRRHRVSSKTIVAAVPTERRPAGTSVSIRAWRAACHTTRARSWRSRSPIWPAAWAAAAGTTI